MSMHRGHVALAALALIVVQGCDRAGDEAAPESSAATDQAPAVTVTNVTDSGLGIAELVVGDGDSAAAGQTAVVHYTGWLFDPGAPGSRGQKFDSSRDRGQPFRFPLGAGRVIRGWDEGVAGMRVGGRRELVIPPELGYGDRGAGGVIPPGATLVFDVELLGVE